MPVLSCISVGDSYLPVGILSEENESCLQAECNSPQITKNLDRVTQFAQATAQGAFRQAGWSKLENLGVNIASSRGLTASLENAFQSFEQTGRVPASTSPLTTAGNISSNILQSLAVEGSAFSFSHSMTCSSALFAIGNACAWLRSNMCTHFLAGGAEAPVTPFTLAQMQALGIYTSLTSDEDYPCRPLGQNGASSKNTFVLGEGAATFAVEKMCEGSQSGALAEITGFGYGNEKIQALTGISPDGKCLLEAMKMALKNDTDPRPIDLILLHAPGTAKGDRAELSAIQTIFGDSLPHLYSNKCLYGHTFGASGALSISTALEIFGTGELPEFGYETILPVSTKRKPEGTIDKVLINAAGFGGVAASIILTRP